MPARIGWEKTRGSLTAARILSDLTAGRLVICDLLFSPRVIEPTLGIQEKQMLTKQTEHLPHKSSSNYFTLKFPTQDYSRFDSLSAIVNANNFSD
jgi:hypothetical protein